MKFWAATACPNYPSFLFNYVSPAPNNFVKYNLFNENCVHESDVCKIPEFCLTNNTTMKSVEFCFMA